MGKGNGKNIFFYKFFFVTFVSFVVSICPCIYFVSKVKTGLLINFNEKLLKDRIKRYVL